MADIANAPSSREFTERDWRDAWDKERGEWKPDSWYLGRNASKFADTHLGGGDYHMQTIDETLPTDHNPFLTDASNYLESYSGGKMGETVSEEMVNNELTDFQKDFNYSLQGYPTADSLNLVKTMYPEEEGTAYGFGEDTNEKTYLDPYTGDMKIEGTRDSGILDEYGNPVTGQEGQVRSDTLETSRWYPGKGVSNLWDMITGQKKWSNPFATTDVFKNVTGEYTDDRQSYVDYKQNHPMYGPIVQNESGGHSGGLMDYEGFRTDLTNRIKENKMNVPQIEDYVTEAGY